MPETTDTTLVTVDNVRYVDAVLDGIIAQAPEYRRRRRGPARIAVAAAAQALAKQSLGYRAASTAESLAEHIRSAQELAKDIAWAQLGPVGITFSWWWVVKLIYYAVKLFILLRRGDIAGQAVPAVPGEVSAKELTAHNTVDFKNAVSSLLLKV